MNLIKISRAVKKLAAGALFLIAAAPAVAGIIGTEVQIGHKFIDRFDSLSSTTVNDGESDIVDVYLGNNSDGRVGYFVDLNSNNIQVDFYFPRFSSYFNSTGPTAMNGLYLSGKDFNAQAFFESASINYTNFGFTLNRVLVLDEHSIGLDFQGLDIFDTGRLELFFEQPATVSEPSPIALLGLGIVIISFIKTKKTRRFK